MQRKCSFVETVQYCWSTGGYLAEFLSSDVEEAIDGLLNQDVLYWIGLSDFAHEGTWRWQESHQIPSYFNWSDFGNQPDGGASSNCGMKTWFHDVGGKWYDQECNLDYGKGHGPIHALCQVDK